MYTIEEHKKQPHGTSIDIRDKTRVPELITYLYNLGFKYYCSNEMSLTDLIDEFKIRDYLVLPPNFTLHPRNQHELTWTIKTIDEILEPESKYYSYINPQENYTVIFKGTINKDDKLISDKNFKQFIIIESLIFSSTSGVNLSKSFYKDLKELSPTSNEALWLEACKDANKYLDKLTISNIKVGDYVFIDIVGPGKLMGKIKLISNDRIGFESEFKFNSSTSTYKEREAINTWAISNNNFIRKCSPKEIDIINGKIKHKFKALGYIVVSYEDGDVYMDCTDFDGNDTFYFNSAIDMPNNTIYKGTDSVNDSYTSYSSMKQEEIDWYKECLKQNKILGSPLEKTLENGYYNFKNKSSEYIIKIVDSNYHSISKNSTQYHRLEPIGNRSWFDIYDITDASSNEIKWMDLCIKHNRYVPEEELLKTSNEVIQDGYYIFKDKNYNKEHVIKIKNYQNKFEFWAIDLQYSDDINHNHWDNEDANWIDNYHHLPASYDLIQWLEDCIEANYVVARKTGMSTSYVTDWCKKEPPVAKDIPVSTYKSSIPNSIKSDVDDLISIPELEIKTTKIVFINNKN